MRILYVTTISNTVNAFLIPHIKMLVEEGHQVDVAFNIAQEVNPEIISMGCNIYDIEFQRSPLSKKNIAAYKKIKTLISSKNYDVIHTHTPTASAIVRLACKKNKKVKVIYTAHGFHFYTGAPIKSWIIYYPIEKILSSYTDLLLTINTEDYNRAKKFNAKKVDYIPGVGLNLKKIQEVTVNKNEIRKELEIQNDAVVMLSVGELNKNKNHEVAIKALAQLENKNIHYLICGEGPLKNKLQELINELKLSERVKLLGFRKDIIKICKSSDLFIFPSFREGLPVSIMEAMACGLPVMCSNIRGNKDLIDNNKGGFLFNPNDVNQIAKLINKLSNSKSELYKYSEFNLNKIEKFDIDSINNQIRNYYRI